MTRSRPNTNQRSCGFTLIELLITISIIGLMASMVLFATYSATEAAKVQKTRALIAKLDAIIKAKWDAYKTRRIPTVMIDEYNDANGNGTPDPGEYIDGNSNGSLDAGEYQDFNGDGSPTVWPAALKRKVRVDIVRDLQRMELPDRWSDVFDDSGGGMAAVPITPLSLAVKIARPSVSLGYLRKCMATTPSRDWEGAECLYLIVTASLQEEGDSRDVFKPGDVADTDGDGFPEFIDGWGRPIKFIRWPVGFGGELQVAASGQANSVNGGGQSYQINFSTVSWPSLSTVNGSYVGGALSKTLGDGVTPDPTAQARITAYVFDPAMKIATATCATPPYTMQPAFGGNPPAPGANLLIFAPDPFDPTGVYPIYNSSSASPPTPADTSRPTFATYPLIFSGGPDKCFGITTDTNPSSSTPLRYSANYVALGPNYIDTTTGLVIGLPADNPLEEFFTANGWRDNIHNHLINTK